DCLYIEITNYAVSPDRSLSLCFSRLKEYNIAAIVAPVVTLGVLAIVLAVLGWLFCVVRKKRQTEGTYRPSAEEQSGTSSAAAPDALKLPKEERLI
uniref:Crumbs homolog 3a n=1 Tax=Scophthalmus maximus TaxID=52904 RepID=A0A8D2ZIW9_SCOMX